MKEILSKNIILLRVIVVKEKNDFFVGKDYDGFRYKLLKTEGARHLNVGDDNYYYVESLGGTFLFKNVVRLISRKEESELLNCYQAPSLHDMGISLTGS